MSPAAELAYALGRLQTELEDLAVGGLRAAGPDRLGALESIRQDLAAIGATHLASRLEELIGGIRGGTRASAVALLRAQASLRLLERLLTLDSAADQLRALGEPGA